MIACQILQQSEHTAFERDLRSRMRPFYFGGPERRVFGVYDPPQASEVRDSSVVLCYPHGQEYTYAFRAYRTLATRLARAGFPVLRFDYLGTGDSASDIDDISLHDWTTDILVAVEEVRTCFHHSSVSLVGFRLGAAIAAVAAAECSEVDRLVLWDPVVEGSEYVARLQACHREWFQDLVRVLPRARLLSVDDELLGYRFTERLKTDIDSLSLRSLTRCPARDVLIITQEKKSDYSRLAGHLQKLGARVEIKLVESPSIWSMLPGMQKGLVPNRVLQQIVSWCGSPGNG
jgi:pimeloyl-ACP methyl ester carboxylesterase